LGFEFVSVPVLVVVDVTCNYIAYSMFSTGCGGRTGEEATRSPH